VLNLVVQGCVEVGAFLQVLLGVGVDGRLVFLDLGAGMGWQGHGGGNGGRGDHGEKIEVHGGYLEDGGLAGAGEAMDQTYAWGACGRNSLRQ